MFFEKGYLLVWLLQKCWYATLKPDMVKSGRTAALLWPKNRPVSAFTADWKYNSIVDGWFFQNKTSWDKDTALDSRRKSHLHTTCVLKAPPRHTAAAVTSAFSHQAFWLHTFAPTFLAQALLHFFCDQRWPLKQLADNVWAAVGHTSLTLLVLDGLQRGNVQLYEQCFLSDKWHRAQRHTEVGLVCVISPQSRSLIWKTLGIDKGFSVAVSTRALLILLSRLLFCHQQIQSVSKRKY